MKMISTQYFFGGGVSGFAIMGLEPRAFPILDSRFVLENL